MPLITISQSLDESYNKHNIIPDVIDPFVTQGLLTIAYSDEDQVALGNTLKVSKTQNKPKIQFTLNSSHQDGTFEPISNNDKFILVLTDPDAPSNTDHKNSEYAHWLVTDLKLSTSDASDSGNDISHFLDYSKGKEILSYTGPAPPPKTGKHRYVYLLYKQDSQSSNFQTPKGRPTWGTGIPGSGVRDWIKKNSPNSKLLSVNFFYAQNEDN
ncbi:phosphatidylethanolamine-binding protein [Scheffersomyces amazonensis]|uniref:phosphatidylethanolamine-binding protein n=1 Tax=Scheffersomyces amazonensis TaxID=1078765 RepID=UPI00315D1618